MWCLYLLRVCLCSWISIWCTYLHSRFSSCNISVVHPDTDILLWFHLWRKMNWHPFNGWLSYIVLNFVMSLVTLQAQKEYPPDMQCKDKFLLQSTIVNNDSDELSPDTVRIWMAFCIMLKERMFVIFLFFTLCYWWTFLNPV